MKIGVGIRFYLKLFYVKSFEGKKYVAEFTRRPILGFLPLLISIFRKYLKSRE